MVRQFKLKNEKGQECSLMDIEQTCLLTDPSGLGYSYSSEYEQLGNTFINVLRKMEQGKIAATLNFMNYDNYKQVVDFIQSAEKLKFSYTVPYSTGAKEYYKDIEIQAVAKSQIQENGIISEPINIDCLSLWYEENTTTYTISAEDNELRWDFKWDSRFVDYDVRRLQFINKGHTEAPIVVEIDGHVINPKISLFIEGQLIQQVPITVEVAQYEKLLYGTKENEFYINRQKTDGTLESLFTLDNINIANDNVIRLPKNKSCELRLTADNEILNAQITILVYYVAV